MPDQLVRYKASEICLHEASGKNIRMNALFYLAAPVDGLLTEQQAEIVELRHMLETTPVETVPVALYQALQRELAEYKQANEFLKDECSAIRDERDRAEARVKELEANR